MPPYALIAMSAPSALSAAPSLRATCRRLANPIAWWALAGISLVVVFAFAMPRAAQGLAMVVAALAAVGGWLARA